MKTLLVAINAKYIHTNLAVRYLNLRAKQFGFDCSFAEYTINQSFHTILSSIYAEQPDIIAFSCYLWNIELIRTLCVELEKLLPNTKIWLGGPEVSYHSKETLKDIAQCELIMRGEAEQSFVDLLTACHEQTPMRDVNGIVLRQADQIVETPPAIPFDLGQLPFAYEDLAQLPHRIVYFETSRGCPYSCSYCLSSIEKGVRFMPADLACSYLQRFIDANVPQVKFVDRTFNCNVDHADTILCYLIDHDNGITNFHFEISADILKDSTIALISKAREGLFQFEVGVQSTNEQTIQAIRRACDNEKLFEQVRKLQAAKNAHIHLDLIAGLPLEDYASFANSYDMVFALHPNMLQLGFLKVLKGSSMELDCKEHGIVYQSRAPYEVLYTNYLSYEKLCQLKQIDTLNDMYLNSGRFRASLPFVLRKFSSPFAFFEQLRGYFVENNLFDQNIGKFDWYVHLYTFYSSRFKESDGLKWCVKYDTFSRENARSLPDFCNVSLFSEWKDKIDAFYLSKENIDTYLPHLALEHPKRIAKMTHIEVFPQEIQNQEQTTALLFDYSARDVSGNAKIHHIKL